MPSLNFTFEEEVMSLCTKIDFITLWLSLLLSLQFQSIDPCVICCHSTCLMPLGYEPGPHYQRFTSHFDTNSFGYKSFRYKFIQSRCR